MYLFMDDTRSISECETKLEQSNKKFVEIKDDDLEEFTDTFLTVFTKILEQNSYCNIKICNKKPNVGNELYFNDLRSLSFNKSEINIQGKDTLEIIKDYIEDLDYRFPVCDDEGYLEYKMAKRWISNV